MNNEIWIIRFLPLNHRELQANQHAIGVLISELEEYFENTAFNVKWLKTPDFTIYPFSEAESSTVYVLNEISNDVTIKGDIIGFSIPNGKTLDKDDLISISYKEQMVFRVEITWNSDISELTLDDIVNQVNYLASTLSSNNTSLLSIEIKGDGKKNTYLNEFLDTVISATTNSEKKNKTKAWYNISNLPSKNTEQPSFGF